MSGRRREGRPPPSDGSVKAAAGGARGPVALAVRAGAPAARWALGVLTLAALTAASARVAVALPGTAVPFTLQPVAVLLAGFLLGARGGAAAQAAYLAAGVAGLPVFAAGGGAAYLLGPTGGYLLAFPAAAAVAGLAADRGGGILRLAAGGVGGVLLLHAGGLAWLSALLGPAGALEAGVEPFVWGDVLKVGLAVLVAARLRGPVRRLLGRRT